MTLRSIRKLEVDAKWENEDPECVYEIYTGGCMCCTDRDEVPLATAIDLVNAEISHWKGVLEELLSSQKEAPPFPGETKEQCAKRKGAFTFDCALPQPWLDAVVNGACKLEPVGSGARTKAYDTVLAGTVWCYDKNRTFGNPFFLTQEAANIVRLAELNDDRVYTA